MTHCILLDISDVYSLAEEKLLVKFFGDEYVQYRNRVGTKIPFVP